MKNRFITAMLSGILFMCQALIQYALDPQKKITQYMHQVWGLEDGLFDDTVYEVMEDDRGNLWTSSNNGIFRVGKKELEDFFEGKTTRVQCTFYNEKDGMSSRECNGGTQPSAWKSRDGKLWFPTTKGAAMIDPGNIKTNPLPPPVQIEKIIADSREIVLPAAANEENLVLPPPRPHPKCVN